MSPLAVPTLPQLRRYAIARSLFEATSLPRAIARLGFVQADPMRAPARAQDLILAQRVTGYRAGELERRYPRLAIEEAFFFNYGFLPRGPWPCCIRAGRRAAGTPGCTRAPGTCWPSCASTVAPSPGTCRRTSTMAASGAGAPT